MPSLHIINQSPLSSARWHNSLRCMQPHDSILLIEDGTLALLQADLTECTQHIKRYVLQADLDARGLNRFAHSCQVVDYSGFVQLTETHHPVICWHE